MQLLTGSVFLQSTEKDTVGKQPVRRNCEGEKDAIAQINESAE